MKAYRSFSELSFLTGHTNSVIRDLTIHRSHYFKEIHHL